MTDQGSPGAPSAAQGPTELAGEANGHARSLTDREFRAAVEASDIGLWVFDVVEDSVVWSPSLCRIAGVTDDDRPRSYADWRELVHPEDLARVEAMVQESLLRGEYPDLEYRVLRTDGEVRHIFSKGSAERGPDGVPRRLTGIVIDVTEQRRLEAQIREDMRLESLGRLAGGIAHDFNNMLTVILGSANLALDLSGATGMVADNLAAIRDAAERSATLTAQLLAFARRHASLPRPTDLGELVTRGLGLVRHLVGPAIQIATDLAPSVPVEVDPNQFQQVLMNLAANARDALPNGGTMTVRTRVELRGRRSVAFFEVEDDGAGISPEVLPRVFEPFFSTKGPLGGAGLGLATVYGIVRQHGGHVHMHSEMGRGTRVVIELPTTAAPLTKSAPARSQGAESAAGPVRPRPGWVPTRVLVLLVDDEPRVRAVTSTLLRRLGHEVLEANDGVEALALAAVRPPDLVVTDLVMPRVGGLQLIEALRDGRPFLPAIVMTGFGSGGAAEAGFGSPDLARDVVWIAKPFHPDVLAERVTTLLTERKDTADSE
jgi:PAS domain S-box-containing protein